MPKMAPPSFFKDASADSAILRADVNVVVTVQGRVS